MGRIDEAAAVYVGDTLAAAVYMGDVLVWPTAPPPEPTIEIVATANGAQSTTANLTFADYVPQENDLVIVFAMSNSTAAIWGSFDSVNWTLIDTDGIHNQSGTAETLAYAYHWVTEAEEMGVDNTYSVRFFAVSEDAESIGFVVRGADLSTPIEAFAVGDSGGTGAVGTHVLPGLDGASLSTGSLVVSVLAVDSTTAVSGSVPSGWSFVQATTGTNALGGLYVRDSLATAGVSVSAENISSTPSSGYIAATLAIRAAA